MYVHSVKLVNYKSFGDYPENEIILEPGVTAIIGKNESGKSNILDGLSCIRFTVKNNAAFHNDNINRSCHQGAENRYIVSLMPTPEDVALDLVGETRIEISGKEYTACGSILSYYLKNVYPHVEKLFTILGDANNNPLNFQKADNRTQLKKCYRVLLAEDMINIPQQRDAIEFIKKYSDRFSEGNKEELRNIVELAYDEWYKMIQFFPMFFYRNRNKSLNQLYTYNEIENALMSENDTADLFVDLIKAIDVSPDDFLLAAKSGDSPQQINLRDKIGRQVQEKINDQFSNFYKTEGINFQIGFNSGRITFAVRSNNGSTLMLSERSNGLRWYIETFIDALANDLTWRNVVYLIDEPDLSLHVNAQRELLGLFRHLVNNGNQVVYTTHSPYMLDTEIDGIHRIRAVVKDSEGNSRVYKTAYDARIAPESQQDTLAPIISALGMNLQDTFGPAKDKINIVTEGVSDYIYLCTMAKILGVNSDKYTIIPSVGATNCVNVCLILHGWSCRYIALFDYGKEGVESGGEILRKGLIFECGKQYCYVCDVTEDDIKAKKYTETPIMIEDVMGRDEVSRFIRESGYAEGELGKTLTAKLMCTAIENGQFILSEDSKNNFKTLFDRILSCCAG